MGGILNFPGSGKKDKKSVQNDTVQSQNSNVEQKKVTVFEYEKIVGKLCRSKEYCKTGMILAVKKDAKDRIVYLVSDVDAGMGLISQEDLFEKWEIEE